MVPWNKLPSNLQKAILAMVVVFGGTSTACRLAPPICDPPPPPPPTPQAPPVKPMISAPPPPTTPKAPTFTPMICDPPPPPSMTPTLKMTPTITPTTPGPPTPMICDPAPPPSATGTPMICDPPPPPPSVTVAPGQRFTPRLVQITSEGTRPGVSIHARIVDQNGQPLGGLWVVVEYAGEQRRFQSDRNGTIAASFSQAGTYILSIEWADTSRLTLELKLHEVATIEWVESGTESRLPLAEIRVVDIVWQDGLSFAAETPWPGAHYRWSVSGGTLVEAAGGVAWQPPAEPGRYLLQVVADWGWAGLAVDAVVLAVEEDGRVTWHG